MREHSIRADVDDQEWREEELRGPKPLVSARSPRGTLWKIARRSTRFFSHTIRPAPVERRSGKCICKVDRMRFLRVLELVAEVDMKSSGKRSVAIVNSHRTG
jgi:hypothetical protein